MERKRKETEHCVRGLFWGKFPQTPNQQGKLEYVCWTTLLNYHNAAWVWIRPVRWIDQHKCVDRTFAWGLGWTDLAMPESEELPAPLRNPGRLRATSFFPGVLVTEPVILYFIYKLGAIRMKHSTTFKWHSMRTEKTANITSGHICIIDLFGITTGICDNADL